MRGIAVICLAAALVACGSENPELQGPTTTAVTTTSIASQPAATTSTRVPASMPPTTSPVAEAPATTTTTSSDRGFGTEAVGVTDSVTIVVHDTKDGP